MALTSTQLTDAQKAELEDAYSQAYDAYINGIGGKHAILRAVLNKLGHYPTDTPTALKIAEKLLYDYEE